MLALTTILASSTARKLAMLGVAAGALLGTGLYARHEHSVAAALHVQVAAEQAQVAEVTADAARNQAALESAAADAARQETAVQAIRSQIDESEKSTNCAGSPAVRALLNGLRAADDSRTPATRARHPAHVSRSAGDAE